MLTNGAGMQESNTRALVLDVLEVANRDLSNNMHGF